MVCDTCKHEERKTYARKPGKQEIEAPPCSKCKSTTKITQIIDMVEELSVIADQMGTEVVFISADFEEGEQLLNAFGGIAAILRYHTGI